MVDLSVVIYGQTVFCTSLYDLLAQQVLKTPKWGITSVSSVTELLSLSIMPNLIFMERNGRDDIYYLPPAYQAIPILALDIQQDLLTVVNQQPYTVDSMFDLVAMIVYFSSFQDGASGRQKTQPLTAIRQAYAESPAEKLTPATCENIA